MLKVRACHLGKRQISRSSSASCSAMILGEATSKRSSNERNRGEAFNREVAPLWNHGHA